MRTMTGAVTAAMLGVMLAAGAAWAQSDATMKKDMMTKPEEMKEGMAKDGMGKGEMKPGDMKGDMKGDTMMKGDMKSGGMKGDMMKGDMKGDATEKK